MDKTLVFLVLAMSGIFALALTYNKLQIKTVKSNNENFKIKSFNSNEFQVIENPGFGDCLFYCFKQALESIGVKTTIKQLRYKVSQSMDKEKLETLKTIYLVAKNDKNYDILKDYYFMENVDTLKDLRKVIMTRVYYGDGQWVLLGLHYNMLAKPENRFEISENQNNSASPSTFSSESPSEKKYFKSKFSVKFDISSNGKYLPITEDGKGKINLGDKIKDYKGLPLIINGYLDDQKVRDLGDIVVSNMMIYHDYLNAKTINYLYNRVDPIQVNKNLKCYWKIKSSKFLSTYPMVEDSVSYNDMIFYYTDRRVLIQDVPTKAK